MGGAAPIWIIVLAAGGGGSLQAVGDLRVGRGGQVGKAHAADGCIPEVANRHILYRVGGIGVKAAAAELRLAHDVVAKAALGVPHRLRNGLRASSGPIEPFQS